MPRPDRIDISVARVLWRIVFEVCEGDINLRKEISIWELPSKTFTRALLRQRWDIPLIIDRMENVTLEKDYAQFENGYIKFVDQHLEEFVQAQTSDEFDLSGLTQADLGENLGVMAEVNFLGEQPDTFPMFFYPQDMTNKKHYVAFFLRFANTFETIKRYKINWRIQGKSAEADNQYGVAENYLWHRVTVRQSEVGDVMNKGNAGRGRSSSRMGRFEFMADGIPMGDHTVNQPRGRFIFKSEEKECYIGAVPGPTEYGEMVGLTGGIRRLVFDPNDSCPTCRG